MALIISGCSKDSYDDSELWQKVNSIDQRVTQLENTLSQMNRDLSSVTGIVSALQQNVSITNVVQTATGYQITFSNGKVININHGKDGKDGINGTNGVDGQTPTIGDNGNWWIGQTDTGVPAGGQNGLTPHIGDNGNWWIGQTDTGVPATSYIGGGNSDVPIISIEEYQGVYYWVQILNGVRTWLTDASGNKMPVSGKDGQDGISPIIRVDASGYWVISYDGGITFTRITNFGGQPVKASGDCECQQFFRSVQIVDDYFVMVLIDGTVIRFYLGSAITPTPQLPISPNVPFPNPRFVTKYVPGRGYVLYIYLPGIKNPDTGEWLSYSDGSDGNVRNFYVKIDDEDQIIDIDHPENEDGKRMPTDLTFLVDNSGSMSEEADYVAKYIIEWSQWLESDGQDVQFGVVGFSIDGTINGALDLTTAQRLNNYLNYNNRTGTDRTMYFTDTRMRDAAASYKVNDECGILALRYADANMSFRSDSYRAYVIFTDEPNQPNYNMDYSVSWFEKSKNNWDSNKGAIYTFYSANDSFTETLGSKENYKWLKEYTGGEYVVTDTKLSGLNYKNIDFYKGLEFAGIINIDIPSSMIGYSYPIMLTFISADNSAVAQQTFYVPLVVSE